MPYVFEVDIEDFEYFANIDKMREEIEKTGHKTAYYHTGTLVTVVGAKDRTEAVKSLIEYLVYDWGMEYEFFEDVFWDEIKDFLESEYRGVDEDELYSIWDDDDKLKEYVYKDLKNEFRKFINPYIVSGFPHEIRFTGHDLEEELGFEEDYDYDEDVDDVKEDSDLFRGIELDFPKKTHTDIPQMTRPPPIKTFKEPQEKKIISPQYASSSRCVRCCSTEGLILEDEVIGKGSSEEYKVSIPICLKCSLKLDKKPQGMLLSKRIFGASIFPLAFFIIDMLSIHSLDIRILLFLLISGLGLMLLSIALYLNYSRYKLKRFIKYLQENNQVLVKPKCTKEWVDLNFWMTNSYKVING